MIIYKIKNNISSQKLERLMSFVSTDKKKNYAYNINIKCAKDSVISDLVVRSIICHRKKIKNAEIIFEKNEKGKPYIKNFNDIHFNISHSGDWIICGVHNSPIGVDLELIKDIDFNTLIYYMNSKEINDFLSLPTQQKKHYIYSLWTIKESYIKYLGKGLSLSGLKDISINVKDKKLYDSPYSTKVNFYVNESIPNYILSICTKDLFPIKIIEMDIQTIETALIESEYH